MTRIIIVLELLPQSAVHDKGARRQIAQFLSMLSSILQVGLLRVFVSRVNVEWIVNHSIQRNNPRLFGGGAFS